MHIEHQPGLEGRGVQGQPLLLRLCVTPFTSLWTSSPALSTVGKVSAQPSLITGIPPCSEGALPESQQLVPSVVCQEILGLHSHPRTVNLMVDDLGHTSSKPNTIC